MKKLFMYLLLLLPLAIASCGGDKDEPDNNGGNNGNGENTTNYIADFSTKTAMLGEVYPCFYEDYNLKYHLLLIKGCIAVEHYVRHSGQWEWYGRDIYGNISNFGIKDVGKVNKITDITGKDVSGNDGDAGMYTNGNVTSVMYALTKGANFQPGHGYIIMFKTENNEVKYMRVFAVSYKDNNGLSSVTIQYQLY